MGSVMAMTLASCGESETEPEDDCDVDVCEPEEETLKVLSVEARRWWWKKFMLCMLW